MKKAIAFTLACAMLLLTGCACSAKQPTPEPMDDLSSLLADAERLMLEDNYEEAILKYEAAIRIEPRRTDTYVKLSEVYAAAGDEPQALRTLQQAMTEIGPEPALRTAVSARVRSIYTGYAEAEVPHGITASPDGGGQNAGTGRYTAMPGVYLLDLDGDGMEEMIWIGIAEGDWDVIPLMQIFSLKDGAVEKTQELYLGVGDDAFAKLFCLDGGSGRLLLWMDGSDYLFAYAFANGSLECVTEVLYTDYFSANISSAVLPSALREDEAYLSHFKAFPWRGDSTYLLYGTDDEEDGGSGWTAEYYASAEEAMNDVLSHIGLRWDRNAQASHFLPLDGYTMRQMAEFSSVDAYLDESRFDMEVPALLTQASPDSRTEPANGSGQAASPYAAAMQAYAALLTSGRQPTAADYAHDWPWIEDDGTIPMEGFALLDIDGDGVPELLAGISDVGGEVEEHDWGIEMLLVNIYTCRNGVAELLSTADVSRYEPTYYNEMHFVNGRYLVTYESGTSGYLECHYGDWDPDAGFTWTRFICEEDDDYAYRYTRDGAEISEEEFYRYYADDDGFITSRELIRFYANNSANRAALLVA